LPSGREREKREALGGAMERNRKGEELIKREERGEAGFTDYEL